MVDFHQFVIIGSKRTVKMCVWGGGADFHVTDNLGQQTTNSHR